MILIVLLTKMSTDAESGVAGAEKARGTQAAGTKDDFQLRILHTNDTHAHLDLIARRITAIKQLRTPNTLLLDAGDVFAGTPYFTQYEGLADLWFMNAAGYDGMTFGNHEFDRGTGTLRPFIQGASFPFVSANITYKDDPNLGPLLVDRAGAQGEPGHIYPSIIRVINGERVGIIGLTTPEAAALSSPGQHLVFREAMEAARHAVAALQAIGVNKIIALTHHGLAADQKLADTVPGIDIIVGGHSHTRLAAPAVRHADREPTLIVQAGEHGTDLGQLDVQFNGLGVVTNWSGKLIALDETKPDGTPLWPGEPASAAKLKDFAMALEQVKGMVVGNTKVTLDGEHAHVRTRETNLGNLIADGMLDKIKSLVHEPDAEGYIAIQNSGNIRASIRRGPITLGNLLMVMPFSNKITALKMTGDEIIAALENGVSGVEQREGRFPQVAGMRFYYDSSKQGERVDAVTHIREAGHRIVKVQLLREDGSYSNIKPDALYVVATNTFMARGGDFYTSMKRASDAGRRYKLELLDYEVISGYLGKIGRVRAGVEGRIVDLRGVQMARFHETGKKK
ncbi:bifunctional metallophosphatase/5'-nucleotidase [Paenibacillus sp. MMS18-CY102]|nr:bifunctional metallophosphatase/5'-nucleotidase [Paenibacillus sp. MMS18-CY102]